MADLLAAAAAPLATTSAAARDATGKVIGLSAAQLGDLKEQAIAWAAAHGLLVGWRDPTNSGAATFTHIPFCLLPVQVQNNTNSSLDVVLALGAELMNGPNRCV